jgi:hypothetical protein
MKQNLLDLLVIQHVYFGKLKKLNIISNSLSYYRLAFLPIYFTAYETGRHQVI